jgi:hypothetical protein
MVRRPAPIRLSTDYRVRRARALVAQLQLEAKAQQLIKTRALKTWLAFGDLTRALSDAKRERWQNEIATVNAILKRFRDAGD